MLGESLEALLRRKVLMPLGLSRDVRSVDLDHRRLVECRLTTEQETRLAAEQGLAVRIDPPRPGEVQDGNARWLGRYSGHAGLFGSARALWRLGAEWLQPRVIRAPRIADALAGKGRFRLGWWRARVSGSAGPGLSRRSFGHTGYTGGSLWVDCESGRIFVLLAHRASETVDMKPWRRRMHRLSGKE